MTTKITKKDNFNSLIELADKAGREDLVEFLNKEIASLEKKAAKAKAAAAEKRAAGDELKDVIASALTSEFASIADITAKVAGEDVTSAKVSYRLTKLVEDGVAEKTEITIKEEGKKARKQVQYRLASAEE